MLPPLRPYQLAVVRDVEHTLAVAPRAVLQMPTGSGKTIVAAEMARRYASRRMLYVVPSIEIFNQTESALKAAGLRPAIMCAGEWPKLRADTQCVLASANTLQNRLTEGSFAQWLPELVIVDECHKLIDQHATTLATFPRARSLGLTATPVRLDGQPLAALWPALVEGPQPLYLQSLKVLVPIRTLCLPLADTDAIKVTAGDFDKQVLGKIYEAARAGEHAARAWMRYGKGRPTLAFCPNRRVSESLALSLRHLRIRAVHLDATVSDSVRQSTIAELLTGKLDVVTNCGLFIEGLDVPKVSCVVICTSTVSLPKWLQMVGRGTRPAPGKLDLLVIDHGKCRRRLGDPAANRDWTMGGQPL